MAPHLGSGFFGFWLAGLEGGSGGKSLQLPGSKYQN